MVSSDPRNPIEIFKDPLEVQTAGKIFVLCWAEFAQQNRKDPDNPTDEELKNELQAGNNFGNRLMCWAEAYHQLRARGELSGDQFKDYDPGIVAAARQEWRELYEASVLFEETEDDKRFK